jgi:hypothetical protein
MRASAAYRRSDCHAQPLFVADMTRVKPTHSVTLPLFGALLLGCQTQFVSPYSADVQKRASDMISEISAWELQMRETAGTPDADPRQPNIRAKFANWSGELEAMAAIETALNPDIIQCDRLAAAVTRKKHQRPLQLLPVQVARLRIKATRCKSSRIWQ